MNTAAGCFSRLLWLFCETRYEACTGRKDVYTVNHAVLQSAGHLTSPRTCWTGVQHPNRHACSVEMGEQTPHPPPPRFGQAAGAELPAAGPQLARPGRPVEELF